MSYGKWAIEKRASVRRARVKWDIDDVCSTSLDFLFIITTPSGNII